MPQYDRRPSTSSNRPTRPSASSFRTDHADRADRADRAGRPASGRSSNQFYGNSTFVAPAGLSYDLEAAFAAAPVAEDTGASWLELGLPERLVAALERREVLAPFPIQAATLRDALGGRDVLGRASTGSGKTLAFGLPMLARLAGVRSAPNRPRGLVLVPTRELATQVRDALEPLAQAIGIRVTAVYGGAAIQRQQQLLSRGVDIVVATPGRLQDLVERGDCVLGAVEVTAIDEADHMSDLGFLPTVTRLLDTTPEGSQRLLFSATLDGAVGRLVARYLREPALHAVASATSQVDTMDHRAFIIRGSDDKAAILSEIATRPARTLLFVRTKHGADRLAARLASSGVNAAAIHGDLRQAARQRALDDFQSGRTRVLVATDVAARGIHVDDVDLVVHVDPPADHKDYLHRSGRTARAGASGVVLSLLLPSEARGAEHLRRRAGVEATVTRVVPGDAAVRELAESGTPVVVKALPPRRSAERTGARRPGQGPRTSGFVRPRSDRPRTDRSERTDRVVTDRPRTERVG